MLNGEKILQRAHGWPEQLSIICVHYLIVTVLLKCLEMAMKSRLGPLFPKTGILNAMILAGAIMCQINDVCHHRVK